MVRASNGEAKMFPTGSAALLRELLAEDAEESIMGKTYIVSHTGTARDTAYKFREVKVPRAKQVLVVEDDSEGSDFEETAEPIPDKDEQDALEAEVMAEKAAKKTTPRKPKPKTGSAEDFHEKAVAKRKREEALQKQAENPSVEELQDEESEGK
jgi:hypothetical protein